MFKKFIFETLQGRLIILLLLPVFLIIFSGGVLSFFYARDTILNQWNESAVLKLQRAADNLEMRLIKPVEAIEMFLDFSKGTRRSLSPELIIQYLKKMDGVVAVGYTPSRNRKGIIVSGPQTNNSPKGKMRFRHSRISTVSKPILNSDIGHETVTLVVAVENNQGIVNGQFIIKLDFHYLLKDIIELGWWQSDMACIVNKSGDYMAHTNMSMKDRKHLGDQNDLFEIAIRSKMQEVSYGTVRSKGRPPDMIAGFYSLAKVPWTIVLFAEGEKLMAPMIKFRNAFGLGSIILIMTILFLIRRHVSRLVGQITDLSENAQKVAKGEYTDPVEAASRDEIGRLVSHYNAMVAGLKERDFIRDTFGRYVDPGFAKQILKHPDAGRLGGKRQEVVLLMSDIRGFTALSETLSPEVIIRILNQYFSRMIRIIQDHNGIIIDFFGDAVLVLFDPFSQTVSDTSLCALQCAARMQSQMFLFNEKIAEEKLPSLGMGIGINAGSVIVGNIGSKTRAKYGVVGSAVNVTSRIQAKAGEGDIVISDEVYKRIKDQVNITKTFQAQLKGIDDPVLLRTIENIL